MSVNTKELTPRELAAQLVKVHSRWDGGMKRATVIVNGVRVLDTWVLDAEATANLLRRALRAFIDEQRGEDRRTRQ